jgi:uncharacterized membrane protein
VEEFGIAILVLSAFAIPFVALVLAIVALKRANDRTAASIDEKRMQQLESRIRQLDQRLRALEPVALPVPEPMPAALPMSQPQAKPEIPPARTPVAPSVPSVALEQRIGARWATWVGVLSLIITVGLLLRWTFENNLIGPVGRVVLGLTAGTALLVTGLALRARRTLPFLAEGFSGGGLAILYLSLYAANTVYGMLGTGLTFALMSGVTLSGIAVALASDRQATAVLAVLGGLLTPILVSSEHPDERVLISYLFVLGALVLGVATRRSWIALNRLAWAGSMLLLFAVLQAKPDSPHPVARLALLSALAALFAAVPLAKAWLTRHPVAAIDLWIVVGNAAAYFSAVYLTLERWRPRLEGPWALALGAVYVTIARRIKRRVPADDATVGVHLGNAIVLATLAFPLALDGPWVTLGWAAQGAVLVWLASRRVDSTTALAGGLAVLVLAVVRVVAVDPWAYAPSRPVWNAAYAVHLLVVVALIVAGWVARHPADATRGVTGRRDDLRTALWFAAGGLLAILLWREPPGLWPAGLLLGLLIVVAWLGRVQGDRAFVVATPMLAAILFARLFVEDYVLARNAAGAWVNAPLMLRLAACAALALAGHLLSGSQAPVAVARLGRILRGAAGVTLLGTLSIAWILRQGLAIQAARAVNDIDAARHLQWKQQVGLSVLFTLYAAAALAWGFVRKIPAVRYFALGLLGIVIVKVFLIDLAELQAIYRILSFLVLGVVLLGVSYVYQRRKPTGSGSPAA